MTPPTRRRLTRDEQRAETRQRLLDAAAEVFAARGVEGAAIDEISERAGYSRGAFYSNFAGKPAVLAALSEQRLQRFADELIPVLRDTPDGQRIDRAATFLAGRGTQDVLLLIELARLRGSTPDVDALLDGFAARLTDVVVEQLRDPSFDLGGPTEAQLVDGARAMVAAVLGVMLLTHLGVDDRQRTASLLLEGALRASFPDAPVPDGADADLGADA